MTRRLSPADLEPIAIGAALLGSGGGGSPAYDMMAAQCQMERSGAVRLLSVEDLKPDDLVVPLAYMGSPLIGLEKLGNGQDLLALLSEVERFYGRLPTALMPGEIGGSNAFAPLLASALTGIPVLDADTIGRAFPELQMSTCNLCRVSPNPAFLSDHRGQTVVLRMETGEELERVARQVTVAMGSSAALAFYLMDGSQAKASVVPGSLTRAYNLGRALLAARQENADPIGALLEAAKGARMLGRGRIVDVRQEMVDGFLQGLAILSTTDGEWTVVYQNEYLAAYCEGRRVACTPDILALVDEELGEAIFSETVAFGQRVALIVLPAPEIWTTPEGLRLVGPQAFQHLVMETEYARV